MTLAELLSALAEVDDRGLRHEDEFVSWRSHVAASNARGEVLRKLLSADRPPHVGVLMENSPEFSYLLGAAAMGAFVLVGLNTTRRGAGLAADVARADCQIVLTDNRTRHLLDDVDLDDVPVIDVDDEQWVISISTGSIRRIRDSLRSPLLDQQDFRRSSSRDNGDASPRPPSSRNHSDASPRRSSRRDEGAAYRDHTPAPDDLMMLIFTSGTTGDPKAVRCTQRKFAESGRMLADRFEIGADDVVYLAMPMFHSNAVIAGWSVAVAGGASIALRDRFSAGGFLRDVRRHGVTFANYVGKPLNYILSTPQRPDDADNTLRIMYGNEASARDRAAFAERFGTRVIDGFGSTEGGVAITRTPDTPPDALGPLRAPTAVIDPATGDPVHTGQIGEIVNSSGPGLFSGYYNDPEASDERLRDGVYHTGDLAWVDEDGYLHFAGRLGDWLRVDGENLGTGPIERILLRHPDVRQVAVYGVPVEIGDEIEAVLVVDGGLDPESFTEFLHRQGDLGPKQWPHRVRLTDALPDTATFKTVKRVLRDDAAAPTWVREQGRYIRDQRAITKQ
ncbi:long-chain-fatty-acid--CoA ligase [Gordonia hankookensis]|uniref:AMP-binding protein n=1 Tax=Gordonia hankookensis TaxID=589403 RepID=A0ABR7W977_9ACTN|nr:long-chain-fatty-acid--CoA ligase [Gordonia hankookensis]MBD1319170.1 AMP-binding protein [Gordonia hankookensis]